MYIAIAATCEAANLCRSKFAADAVGCKLAVSHAMTCRQCRCYNRTGCLVGTQNVISEQQTCMHLVCSSNRPVVVHLSDAPTLSSQPSQIRL